MQGFEAKPWTLLTEETVTKERAVLAGKLLCPPST